MITDYSSLQSEIHTWLGDDAQASRIKSMIALFEGVVKRELRVAQMEGRSTADTVGGQRGLALPAGHLQTRSVYLNISPARQLDFMTPSEQITQFGTTPATPETYCIVGGEYLFGPIPSGEFEVESDHYVFETLNDANPTNWLLTDYPDAYLYGAMGFSSAGDAAEHGARAGGILASISEQDTKARWNGVPILPRADFVTP